MAELSTIDEQLPAPTQAEMKREIASIDKDVQEALFYGGGVKLLTNGDSVLRARGKSLELYEDLERDAHVAAVMDKRKRAVTAREWLVDPASEDAHDQEVADCVKDTLKRLRFDKLSKALLAALLKGFAVVELVWELRDGKVVPVRFIARKQRRFTFDIGRRLRLLTQGKMVEGELLPDRKFIVHSVGGEDGSPFGLGLGHRLFWPVFFKRQNISFWLVFNDKFGSPTSLGKYPSGATETERRDLLTALSAISHDSAVIIPEGMEAELLEAARAGGGDGYERLCNYMDNEISKAVLGETLTTSVSSDGGSRAQATVHDDVRTEVAKDDADDLSATLNDTLVKWIVDLNFPGSAYPTVWREFDEAEDLDLVADRDTKLKGLGWEREDESFIETYGEGYTRVQQPEPTSRQPIAANDQTAAGAPAAVGFAESDKGLLARIGASFMRLLNFAEPNAVEGQRARKQSDQETIAAGAAQLAGKWDELLGGRVKELQTVLDETGDLALFSERLQEMIEAEPDQQVVEALARATFASRLAARSSRGKQ